MTKRGLCHNFILRIVYCNQKYDIEYNEHHYYYVVIVHFNDNSTYGFPKFPCTNVYVYDYSDLVSEKCTGFLLNYLQQYFLYSFNKKAYLS